MSKFKKGFTLIEVVLVLAIAGLIFLIVFLAVSQAQSSQRDTQRRSDAGRIGALLENFAASSDGVYPTPAVFEEASGNWYDNWWSRETLNDPSTGNAYNRTAGSGTCDAGNVGTIFYTRPQPRQYDFTMCLETGEYSVSND